MRLGALVLGAWLAGAGCGAETPSLPPLASASAEVCALAPALPTIVGRTTVAQPASFAIGTSERCLWVFAANPSRYVGLTVGEAATHAEMIRVYGDGEPVAGAGDEARWWPGITTLSVLSGERAFQVDFRLDEGEGSQQLAVDIAEHVLESLD